MDIQTQLPVRITDNTNTVAITSTSALVVNEVSLKTDDAAFTIATDKVMPCGFLADETTPDSVNEGDVGLARMTLTRLLKTKLIGDDGGTDVPVVVDSSGNLQVDVVTGGGSVIDGDTFTVNTSSVVGVAGVFDDSIALATSGDYVGLRSTGYRALHINLRNNSGTEIGTSANPIIIGGSGVAGTPSSAVVTIQGITGGTPIPVVGGEVTTDVISYYNTVSSVANAAVGTISYTVTALKTLMLKQIIASSSGAPCKVVVDTDAPSTIFVGFYASSSPFLSVEFAQPIPIAAGVTVNINITNNAGSSQDVYGFIGGVEI